MTTTTDFLVIGGGIVGVTVALDLTRRFPRSKIMLLEKESDCGLHASGRNSGVLHAGFYYTADSRKARFTRDGNRRMTAYCRARGLRLDMCGKLVVARGEQDLEGLQELLRRGRANGVEVCAVNAREASELEPMAETHETALWSPSTATVDPSEVMRALVRDAEQGGVQVRRGTRYVKRAHAGAVITDAGRVSAGYVVNAAGLHADHIARDFGFAEHYRILPFKGLYLYGRGTLRLRRHVYPVPHLGNPFLGVHFTVTVQGQVKIGPTAIPALWREHYSGLGRFRLQEFLDIAAREAQLFLRDDFGFRDLAMQELRKYGRKELVRLAAELVPAATVAEFTTWGRPGIRAQLLDTRTRHLEMDFVYEGDHRSFHVLNAVSPAFTCALSFSEHLGERIAALLATAE